ncbi:MAG: DUF4169 family protein [Kiloniellaceae bacterium]
MAEIVNLRQARKGRTRAEKDARAATNRTRFGQPKAERRRESAEQARRDTELSSKKLD